MVKTINAQLGERHLLGPRNEWLGGQLTGHTCDDGNFLEKCGNAASDLVGPVFAQKLREKRWPRFSAAQMSRLLCSLGDKKGCDAIGVDARQVVAKRWVCTTSSIQPVGRYCDLVVPATRLVAKPGRIGVVFFDADDYDNAAYAIHAATSDLCDPDVGVPERQGFVADVRPR
jgi:hypothetical protein